jgi:uncharacterized membrane protein
MAYLMIALRIIHILSGVIWVGGGFFNILFLQPAIRATGADGQKVVRYLMQTTRMTATTYTTSTLTAISGLTIYWILSGFQLSFLSSGYGLVLTIASALGLIVWLVVIFPLRNIFKKMAAIGQQVQAQGGQPTPEQAAQMQALGGRLAILGRLNLILVTIAIAGMAMAEETPF